MKTAIKRTSMWLFDHGVLNARANTWIFRVFGLRSA